ncbi:MAG: hypothetical protein ABEL76_06290 [Bradymonadaceae bacterium]
MSRIGDSLRRPTAVVWILALAVPVCVADLCRPVANPAAGAPVDSELDESTARVLHGAAPPDVAWLAQAVRRADRELAVGLRPASDRADGPVWTRSDGPRRRFAAKSEGRVRLEEGRGWWALALDERVSGGSSPRMAGAEVSVQRSSGNGEPTGDPTACPRVGPATFQCGEPSWAYVGPSSIQVDGTQTDCVWAHPLDGRTIFVDFGRIRPASDGRYVLRTALDDRSIGDGGPVETKVRIGGKTETHVHPDRSGWTSTRLPDADRSRRLTLAISAERTGRRHFCFQLESQ